MDVNRISGYIPGKMVFFLMQVDPVPSHRCSTHNVQRLLHMPKVLQSS